MQKERTAYFFVMDFKNILGDLLLVEQGNLRGMT